MAKSRIKYICGNCGSESPKWLGKCPNCNEWNTFTEEIEESGKNLRGKLKTVQNIEVTKLSEHTAKEQPRIMTNIGELDRVLGGGIMPGSVSLIGGDPGIGKSTLVMQASSSIKEKVLYVTGEESINQINLRAIRLKVNTSNFYVLSETRLDIILSAIEQEKPDVVIIDSIQTTYRPEMDNAPGTVTQIRECTAELMLSAKRNSYSVIIVGHVTKEGNIAGPKILEHIVDTVLQFEGERNYSYRILRSQKNRFGSTNEIGIFEMHDTGLSEVKNPSEIFLSERDKSATGSIVTSTIEGTRPVLLEVQALVTPNNFGNPQRVATGFDYRRLSILLAVLEKRIKLRLSANNVFINMAGGLKIFEPAIDLAVCCSIASSLLDKPLKQSTVVIGEVGLGGEVRSISHVEKRIHEAEKLGFETIVVPKNNSKIKLGKNKIRVLQISNIAEAMQILL